MPPRERPISAYEEYLRKRWQEGCHNGAQLIEEIKKQGFNGTYEMLNHLIRDWRVPLRATKAGQKRWVPSPRAVKWLLLQPAQKWRPQEKAFIAELLQRAPTVAKAQELVLAFSSLLRKEEKQTLNDWIDRAKDSGVCPIEQCARGMMKDIAAITAAVELPWSNGQTEGQVHRLKLVKRSMYGRAHFDLLRARVLPMQPINSMQQGA